MLLLGAAILPGGGESLAQPSLYRGARATAMGGAYLAVSDDVEGIAYNPAGLVYAPQRWLFAFSLENLFSAGLPFQNDLQNSAALSVTSIGFVYNRLRRANQTVPVLVLGRPDDLPLQAHGPAPTSNDFSVGAAASMLRTGLLNEITVGVFASRGFFEKDRPLPFSSHLPHGLAVSFAGTLVGVQYDREIVAHADVNSVEEREAIRGFFTEHGRSHFSMGLEVGAMAHLHRRLNLAMAANVLAPDLALAGEHKAPRRLRAGMAVLLEPRRRWLLAADLEHRDNLSGWRLALGSECGLFALNPEVLRVRLGVNYNWWSAGFRLAKPMLLELHYAFLMPALWQQSRPAGFFNHLVTLSFSRPASPDSQ
ncbi:MAG: hypothetical protein ONB48_05510 [candidate division KSB1 bacterium]|nr:hypothetical protein [candidate division KSB1 bacterium]MDZ7273004.1 hypothetical protein [candidate division KSB1 bacterium]MDZ7285107.1 hypothetical protein [candidate division KSB1 bacterium]MDZ7298139.1 hypothetical protein [candidate division KSB1 bacterium]MDZ7308804.1 hypothetical protein [candidate division KSB1 bacterium]